MGDKGKGSGKTMKKAPKADKAGKHVSSAKKKSPSGAIESPQVMAHLRG